MKKIFAVIAVFTAFFAGNLHAQDVTEVQRDSVVYHLSENIDSTLVGLSILDLMPSKQKGDAADIRIFQSSQTKAGFAGYVERNKKRTMTGYRVRIFFDNKQNSRAASEAAKESFLKTYHGIPAYLSYQSPFFKVTVGDFRTKSEAMELLRSVKAMFPAAFIVKENINYPAADREHTFVADTIRITNMVL